MVWLVFLTSTIMAFIWFTMNLSVSYSSASMRPVDLNMWRHLGWTAATNRATTCFSLFNLGPSAVDDDYYFFDSTELCSIVTGCFCFLWTRSWVAPSCLYLKASSWYAIIISCRCTFVFCVNSYYAIVAQERQKVGCRDYATRHVSTKLAKRSRMKQYTLQIKRFIMVFHRAIV